MTKVDRYNYCAMCFGEKPCPIDHENNCPNVKTLRDKLIEVVTEHVNAVPDVTINNPDIINGLVDKGGYCPCMVGKVPCPCGTLPTKEGDTCHCGLFVK